MAMTKASTVSRSVLAAVMGGVLGPIAAAQTYTSGGAASQTANWDTQHVINLQDVDMSVLIDDVSTITGYTFVVHPSVRGQVTVSSQTPLSTAEVFQVFLSTLRVHGFTAVPGRNGVYKIVPEQAAAAEAALASSAVVGDQVETAVFRLRSMDAVEAAKMIKPVTNPQGQVTTSPASNSLIVVDYASNISRVRQLVAEIDRDRSAIATVSLINMPAAEMAKTVNALMAGQSGALNLDIGAIPVESGNNLVLRGDAEDVARVVEIVERLDTQSRPSEESLKVVTLSYASAAEIQPILDGLGQRMAAAATPAGGAVAAPAVLVHEPTNSVIINAEPVILRQLERVVADLDVRRSQVLVEAIVVELSDNATRELGLQFVAAGGENGDIPFTATNFSRSTPNILTLTGALVVDGNGNNNGDDDDDDIGSSFSDELQELAIGQLLGTNGGLFGFGSSSDDGIFGVIINAVQEDVDSNILSTPSVLAMDNQLASFQSGQEIPITTGEALGANNTNPFRQIEREEVGVQLEVTPQISDGDTIRLSIRQEVSSIFGPVVQGSPDLITNLREVTTTILADDGEIIVLGGLIEEDESVFVTKVPFLGDIPGLGRLFRSEGVSSTRRNLMVFLRPTIVRDAEGMRRATARQYNYIRDAQIEASPQGRSSLDEIVRRMVEEETGS